MDSSPESELTPPASRAAPRSDVRRRLLVVDDEVLFGRALHRMLAKTSDPTVLTSAVEALRRIDAGERWDFILCDVNMPVLDGIGFYEALRARHPELARRVAFMSGGVYGARATFFAERSLVVVPKPIVLASLEAAVKKLGIS